MIAIDNLDRCSPTLVTRTLGTIKAFLEPAFEKGEKQGMLKQLCFIVAADDAALRRHLTAQEMNASASLESAEGASSGGADIHGDIPDEVRDSVEEYLRKFFGASVRIRDALPEDIILFCQEEFGEFFACHQELSESERRDLVNMTASVLKRNPRRIIQFVNNLALRLKVLEKRKTERRIQIDPEILFVAKLAILEEEFPDHYRLLLHDPLLYDRWRARARSKEKSETEPTPPGESEPNDEPREKTPRERLDDFLRFTDHIQSRHLRAYLNLKQTRDEVKFERYADLVDALDGGDATAVRALLEEVGDEAGGYAAAVGRYFDKQVWGRNWSSAHNTLRVVIDVSALQGKRGDVVRPMLETALSQENLNNRLYQLDSGPLLHTGTEYLRRGEFNQLVRLVAAGMRSTQDSDLRHQIATAIADHAGSLDRQTKEEIASVLSEDGVRQDSQAFVGLVEAIPQVAGERIAEAALEQMEDPETEPGGDDPPLRVAVVAIEQSRNSDHVERLLATSQRKLEAMRAQETNEYGHVAERLRVFIQQLRTTQAETPHLQADGAAVPLLGQIVENWEAIPAGSRSAAFRLGYELCRNGNDVDARYGRELAGKVLQVELEVDHAKWLTEELSHMPGEFGKGVREELSAALAGLRKGFQPEAAAPVVDALPASIATSIRASAVRSALGKEDFERANWILKNLDQLETKTILNESTKDLAENLAGIEERNPQAKFVLGSQDLIDQSDLVDLARAMCEFARDRRKLAIPVSDLIAQVRISDAGKRSELVNHLLDTEADMSDEARKAAMLKAAIGLAGKRPSNARGAAIGRLRRRLATGGADVARAALELLKAEGEWDKSQGESPSMKFQEVLGPIVDKIKATQGPPNKAELIKPLILLRIKVLKAAGIQEFVWPEFIEAFPSGGGVHNAATQAFRELWQSGEIKCTVEPKPGPSEGFGDGKVILLGD